MQLNNWNHVDYTIIILEFLTIIYVNNLNDNIFSSWILMIVKYLIFSLLWRTLMDLIDMNILHAALLTLVIYYYILYEIKW